MTVEVNPPITIRTSDTTVKISVQENGKIVIDVYQQYGKRRYSTNNYIRDGILKDEH